MHKIVFISSIDYEQQQTWLKAINQLLPNDTILLSEQVDVSKRHEIDIAIVANPDPIDLAKYPKLVWVQSLWAGVEKLVSTFNTNKTKIKLVRLVDPHLAKTMAESVLAWTLYLQRNMPKYSKQQLAKKWLQLPCTASSELQVSILGAGELAIAAFKTLNLLDYKLNSWSRSPKTIEGVISYTGEGGLNALLNKTDILINLLPLTEETYHLLNRKTLCKLPKGSKLINFSRGGVVDSNALIELLNDEHLEHAILDVFDEEPLDQNSAIWHHSKITVLPHISAPTNMTTAAKIVANNINVYRTNGVIPESVNFSTGY